MNSIFPAQFKQYIYVFLFCLFCFSTIVFLGEDTFLYLVAEDGPFETAGALLFFGTSVLFFRLFWKEKNFANPSDRQFFSSMTKRTWFFLIGLFFFILMGEEISWGQRIFGFEGLPGNVQDEWNLHNLLFWNVNISKPGEPTVVKTGIAAWFTAKKIFVYIFLSFLFLLPLSVKFIPMIKNLVRKLHIPVPAVELGILFIINILLFKAFKPWRVMYEGAGRGLSEVEEFNFAFILFMVPFVWLMNEKGFLKLDS